MATISAPLSLWLDGIDQLIHMQQISETQFKQMPLDKQIETLNKKFKGEVELVSDKDLFNQIFPGIKDTKVK